LGADPGAPRRSRSTWSLGPRTGFLSRAEPARGSGLIGLRDRVEARGGSTQVTSRPGEGTVIADVTAAAFLNPGVTAWKTVFAALTHPAGRADSAPRRIRYILVGMSAGEVAGLPAMTLRAAPVQLVGSGIGGRAGLADAAAAYASLLEQVAAGEVTLDIDPVPLAEVEKAWPQAGSDRRVVFVP
jgi:hypothetical protein